MSSSRCPLAYLPFTLAYITLPLEHDQKRSKKGGEDLFFFLSPNDLGFGSHTLTHAHTHTHTHTVARVYPGERENHEHYGRGAAEIAAAASYTDDRRGKYQKQQSEPLDIGDEFSNGIISDNNSFDHHSLGSHQEADESEQTKSQDRLHHLQDPSGEVWRGEASLSSVHVDGEDV